MKANTKANEEVVWNEFYKKISSLKMQIWAGVEEAHKRGGGQQISDKNISYLHIVEQNVHVKLTVNALEEGTPLSPKRVHVWLHSAASPLPFTEV